MQARSRQDSLEGVLRSSAVWNRIVDIQLQVEPKNVVEVVRPSFTKHGYRMPYEPSERAHLSEYCVSRFAACHSQMRSG